MDDVSKIKVGDIYTHDFQFSQAEVEQFAEVTGDKNPLHIDADFASKTIFKQPIMHGFLGGSVFSKIFGTLFPGTGTVYMSQTMQFMRPMFAGVSYRCEVKVTEVNEGKHRGKLATCIIDAENGKVCVRGEAELMHRERF